MTFTIYTKKTNMIDSIATILFISKIIELSIF